MQARGWLTCCLIAALAGPLLYKCARWLRSGGQGADTQRQEMGRERVR